MFVFRLMFFSFILLVLGAVDLDDPCGLLLSLHHFVLIYESQSIYTVLHIY